MPPISSASVSALDAGAELANCRGGAATFFVRGVGFGLLQTGDRRGAGSAAYLLGRSGAGPDAGDRGGALRGRRAWVLCTLAGNPRTPRALLSASWRGPSAPRRGRCRGGGGRL